MPIRPNTRSITQIISIPQESALPHTGGAPRPRRRLSGASHPHQVPRLIPRITLSTRSLPSNPLLAVHPLVRPQLQPPTMDGRRPTSSCHPRFRFRSSMVTLLRPPFSRIRGQMLLLFHKITPIREGWIPSTGAAAARTISEFITTNREDTPKMPTTRCPPSPADSVKMTPSSTITRTNRLLSIISQHYLRYLPPRSTISGRLTSRRSPAGTGRGRWMISICI